MAGNRRRLEEELTVEYERLQELQSDLQSQMERIQEQHEHGAERLRHIQALIPKRISASPPDGAAGDSTPGMTVPNDGSLDAVEAAFSILQAHGAEPIHYRELASLVIERGAELGGKDPAQTLVSRLVTDERFVRPLRRGWYGLRIHFPKAKSVGARKKRSRRAISESS